MFHQHTLVRATATVSAILFLSIATGCSKPEAQAATGTVPGTSLVPLLACSLWPCTPLLLPAWSWLAAKWPTSSSAS